MMQPEFDDVIEYVKAGEDDPVMEETLRLHPEGPELLKQARFICKVLEYQSKSADGGDLATSLDSLVGTFSRVEDSETLPPTQDKSASRTYYQSSAPRRRAKRRTPSIRNLIGHHARDNEELGTLEFTDEGKTVSVSYEASDSAKMRSEKMSGSYRFAQDDIEDIVVHGSDVTLTIANKQVAGRPTTLRVTRSLKGLPAKHFQIFFMPDSGPFLSIRADEDGFIEVPVHDQPGTLRIETPRPQLLRVKIKK